MTEALGFLSVSVGGLCFFLCCVRGLLTLTLTRSDNENDNYCLHQYCTSPLDILKIMLPRQHCHGTRLHNRHCWGISGRRRTRPYTRTLHITPRDTRERRTTAQQMPKSQKDFSNRRNYQRALVLEDHSILTKYDALTRITGFGGGGRRGRGGFRGIYWSPWEPPRA